VSGLPSSCPWWVFPVAAVADVCPVARSRRDHKIVAATHRHARFGDGCCGSVGQKNTPLQRRIVKRTTQQAVRVLFAVGLTGVAWYAGLHLDLALLRRGLYLASLPWLGLSLRAYLGILPIAALPWLA
jgi:hypothetical protein